MKARAYFLLVLLCSFSFETMAAVCEYYKNHQAATVSITLPASTSIARDVSVGTTIYESSTIIFSGANSYKCSSSFPIGIKNLRGADVPGFLFPIDDTGIAWQWIYQGGTSSGIASGRTSPAGGFGFGGTTLAIRFVKIGDIKNNAKIASGALGSYRADTLSPITVNITGMSIVVPSCETPDVIVDMGDHDLSEFSDNSPHSATRHFNIKLNNCPAGITKVKYKLSATPAAPALDQSQGIISLNAGSTAKGIALQIMDSSQRPINLDLSYTYNDYSSTGGNFSIPFYARYLKTNSAKGAGTERIGIRAGTANSEVIFIMSYL